MHDINHEHNYHNRTRHAAKQYNTVEKDCSCKGVAVEASYKCPPGIEAPAARAVGSSFIQPGNLRTVGTAIVGATMGEECPLGFTQPGSGHLRTVGTTLVGSGLGKSCDCEN